MSEHDDRLARLEERVDDLTRRLDGLSAGTPGVTGDFETENDTNRFPPTSEF